MDSDKIYSINDIRAAGKRGEICSIDTEWLITLLKEMSLAESLQGVQKNPPLSKAPIEKDTCTCGYVYESDDTVSRMLDKNCPKHGKLATARSMTLARNKYTNGNRRI